jgi:hypothetical protein
VEGFLNSNLCKINKMIDEQRLFEEMNRRKENIAFALEMASGEGDYRAKFSIYKSLIELDVLYQVYQEFATNPVITQDIQRAIKDNRKLSNILEEVIIRGLTK